MSAAITWDRDQVLSRVSIDPDTGCWNWAKSIHPTGYAMVGHRGKTSVAHRFVYQLLVGPIADGLELDHRCHTEDLTCPGGRSCKHRSCVNPDHLEPMAPLDNCMVGRSFAPINKAKTHCPQNHPYSGWNLITYRGRRYCRACTYARRAAARGQAS